jgi:ATP-dependent RNA helicase DOB1
VLDALLECEEGTESKRLDPKPPTGENSEMVVVPCSLDLIDGLSSVRVYVPNEVKSAASRAQLLKTLKEVTKRFPKGPPQLEPVKDMGIKDETFVKLVEKMAILEKRLATLEISRHPQLDELYAKYVSKTTIGSKIKELKKEIFQAEAVLQLDELKCRKRVLRRLGYINEADVIELKGRVACELSSGDELVIAELIFNGFFNELTAEQSVAILSCFVCDEKVAIVTRLTRRSKRR